MGRTHKPDRYERQLEGASAGRTVRPTRTRGAFPENEVSVDARRALPLWILVVPLAAGACASNEAPAFASARILTTLSGSHGDPRYSRDGRRIAFVRSAPGEAPRVYVMSADGGEPTPVSSAGGGASDPSWSPEGGRISFVRGGSVWMTPLAGGEAVRLTPPMRIAYGTDWSPTGEEILFSAIEGERDGVNADVRSVTSAGVLRRLTSHADGEWFPRWSTDGRRVVFYSTWGHEMTDIHLLSPGGGAPVRLTDHPGEDFRPAFSPDGRWVVFTSRRGGQNDLWIVPSSGGEPRQITNDPALELAADWSPDGRSIVMQYDTAFSQLYSIAADGSDRRQITRGASANQQAVLSPDGGRLAFASDALSVERNILVSSLDGSDPRPIMKSDGIQGDAAWSPEGLALAFCHSDGGYFQARDLWVATMDGAPATRLTTMGDVHFPVWVANGSAIVFHGRDKLWRIARSGGRWGEPELLEGEPRGYVPTGLLPSGELTLYIDGEAVAMRLDAARARRALPAFLHGTSGMRFSPDGSRVTYVAAPDGQSDLYVASRDGRDVRRLTNDAGRESAPSWAPDGERIVFGMHPGGARIAVIEGAGGERQRQRRH